jgi:hypothetical protein
MANPRSSSKKTGQSNTTVLNDVVIESPETNGEKPKPKTKKTQSLVMLDLSQGKAAIYFLMAQAGILVILLALMIYQITTVTKFRQVNLELSAHLKASRELVDATQKTLQEIGKNDLAQLRSQVGQMQSDVKKIAEPPKRRRPRPE